jgi:formylglycine-generating enzyme required for sulfatase activity
MAFVVDSKHSEASPSDSGRDNGTKDEPAFAAVPFSEEQAQANQQEWARRFGIPVTFRDPLGIDYRLIPPGSFPMGNAPEEVNALLRELEFNEADAFERFVAQSSVPLHWVRLTQPFYLASHEVTVAQFRKFVDETGYRTSLEAVKSPPFTWKTLAAKQAGDQCPVIGVSWEDATAFCRWLGKRFRLDCALPTEAQWEYACRAGSAAKWSFGDDTTDLAKHALCEKAANAGPVPVGGMQANAFGLFDMHGNADEWCLDWHKVDFYGRSPADDPACLESTTDPASGRVVRGGAWNLPAWWTRAASRSYDFPGLPVRRHGFRVAVIGDLKKSLGDKASASE